jgi:hypothetical protein
LGVLFHPDFYQKFDYRDAVLVPRAAVGADEVIE